MREDKECTSNKNAATNLAPLRDFAFTILKTKKQFYQTGYRILCKL